MKSTIEIELDFKHMELVPKEYPDWYGIPDIGFIWHNEWADPELEYKGNLINIHVIEDPMYDLFNEETGKDTYEEFMKYVYNNKDKIYELLEEHINGRIED